MTDGLQFTRQNQGWNAEPNIATPQLTVEGGDLLLAFPLNYFVFNNFGRGDIGVVRFLDCSKFRIDGTNDEAWYSGDCRYSRLAPAWGEFYEISGVDPTLAGVDDWVSMSGSGERHFLFYFRDNMFECLADRWQFDPTSQNALLKIAVGRR